MPTANDILGRVRGRGRGTGRRATSLSTSWIEEWRLSDYFASNDGTNWSTGGDSDTKASLGGVNLSLAGTANGSVIVSSSNSRIRITASANPGPTPRFPVGAMVEANGGGTWDPYVDSVMIAMRLNIDTAALATAAEVLGPNLFWNEAADTYALIKRVNTGGTQQIMASLKDPVYRTVVTDMTATNTSVYDLWFCYLLSGHCARYGWVLSTTEPTTPADVTWGGQFRPAEDSTAGGTFMTSGSTVGSAVTHVQINNALDSTEYYDLKDLVVRRYRSEIV